ncbi:MAG: hypothetical protein LBG81_06190, partial [Coriobacteriaceae bacterium]|nr:hypothetical protein [Coriobacteriaceae bacterium]
TYSDEVVRRLASMECAAPDFRIFWDNAYAVHHLSDDPSMQDSLLDIGLACKSAGNPHRYLKFASTSKVTFPGAGISGLAASPENIAEVLRGMGFQTIGHDKLNQLRHVRFLKDRAALAAHMARHAAIIAPKFDLVCRKLEEGLGAGFGVGIGVGEGQHATCTQGTQADPATRPAPGCLGSWNTPRGGYFISFDAPEGTARRIVALAKEAGVVMTGAGASYPYGKDPLDSNIRIAPTLPPLAELETAMDVFVCCVKLASVEKLLEERLASQR